VESGTEQELFSLEELVEAFSLERVHKSGARFNPEKAKWFNEQYLRTYPQERLLELYLPILASHNVNTTGEKAGKGAKPDKKQSFFCT